MTTCVKLIRSIYKDKYHKGVDIMADISKYIECAYCKRTAIKKYYNGNYPYCGNCNSNEYGETIYMCDRCGNPSDSIKDEVTCADCWELYCR